ncbi:unnamed protein product [Thelazia callipaeda]|uniref:Fes1 domain-containing protein n=1 Tax=Thelazia callipaeda TaxID=103827 RepID=A0A0N5D6Q7_THECL|nr:unnamed protein product [Thelazia callipaeda]
MKKYYRGWTSRMSDPNAVPAQCWGKLLCLAQSSNNGVRNGAKQPMSKEDRKFVENAMAEAARATDPVRHMSKYINMLKLIENPSEEDAEDVRRIIDEAEDLLCDIDFARDFCKLGGLTEVIRILKEDCEAVRTEIARVIPLLAENNPYVQNLMFEIDLLPYLLDVLEDDSASEELEMKVLSALSSLIRGHEKTFNQFCGLKGLEKIVNGFYRAIKKHDLKLANKALLVTTSIASSLGEDVVNSNFVPALIDMALQLSADSAGCSYAFDYLSSFFGDLVPTVDSLQDGICSTHAKNLDKKWKIRFSELAERQLEHEKQNLQSSGIEVFFGLTLNEVLHCKYRKSQKADCFAKRDGMIA